MNGPSQERLPASGFRTALPGQRASDVTGGTTPIFHAGTAAHSGNQGFRGSVACRAGWRAGSDAGEQILTRLSARSRAQLAVIAYETGLVVVS
jgi:hypothetical protein